MQNPICTVLMVSYNHSKYIRKALESVLAQKTDYNYIIKIFDDASSDGTQEIIKEYVNKYPDKIIPYLNTQNIGAQENIWRAYKSVDTKYCILLEYDDYWCDDKKLQMQIEALEQHPECSFCGHNMFVITEIPNDEIDANVPLLNVPKKLKEKQIIALNDIEFISDVGRFFPYISARLVRTKALKLESIKNKETILFDICHFYWLISQGPFFYIDKIMSVYRRTGKGIASSVSQMELLNLIAQKIVDFNIETNFVMAPILFRLFMQQTYARLSIANQELPTFIQQSSKKSLLSKFWNAVYKKPIKFVKTKLMRK